MISVTVRFQAGKRYNWGGWYRGTEWWRLRRWLGTHRILTTDPLTVFVGPWWVRVYRVRVEETE
jgi:hypothetical protein